MVARQPRYTKEEFAKHGNELYDSQIRAHIEDGNKGKFIAIDIESGAYKLTNDTMTAVKQLYEEYPHTQPRVIRIGYRAVVHRFGSRSLKKSTRSTPEIDLDSH